MIKLEVKNLPAVLKSFSRQSEKIKEAIRLSLQQSAETVHAEATRTSPYITGNLRRSLTMEVRNTVTPNAYVGTDVVYAPIVEFGGIIRRGKTIIVRRASKGGKGFLNPALKAKQREIVDHFKTNINKACQS